MPIYEYICHDCGHEFEKIVGWSEDAPACVACGGHHVSRQLSPPAIHFKGSGWYITDSRSGQKGKNGANGVSGSSNDDKSSSEKATADKNSSSSNGNGNGDSTAAASDSKSDSITTTESSSKESAKASN